MFANTLMTAVLAASASLVSAASIPISIRAAAAAAAAPAAGKAGSASMTPHDAYSSSIGVLGCKIDINRVAYWPPAVDCNDICVRVTHAGRNVTLLRIDQSGGAHDISYDAWNYLTSGKSATESPQMGGPVDMQWESVDASQCADILDEGGKLPLSASNSINFLSSCLAQPDSYVAKNHVLYNILNPACTWGVDETCTLDLAVSNQPSCPGTLGLTTALANHPVTNIAYGTGKTSVATQ
ncbi:hypothetical protein CMUS01_14230 [Colletotrichum musicola]|uniref:Cerato-platanin n=1 Tax=Colletotrichum musicola TaxID=2175873 RepID=A0A8H6J600_9PEZI|nr:hypothetical protein CMUS01_14230 [Colletotrichum musicola]